jgi:hypothetical protein
MTSPTHSTDLTDPGLRGRVALITGAAHGLGYQIARQFGAHGAWVAINYFADNLGAKSLLDTIRSEGGRAMMSAGNVRDAEGAWKVARYVELEWAQIDVLIHTAALLEGHETVSDPAALLADLLPGMRERGWGRVVLLQWSDAPPAAIPSDTGGVLVNTIMVPRGYSDADGAARLALCLGSGWNVCLTGTIVQLVSREVQRDA